MILKSRGQVTIELAISFVGFVMMTYVTLKAWAWLSTIVMTRQAAFQSTRLQAGSHPGMALPPPVPVPNNPPMLQIIGAPGRTTGSPGGIPTPPLESPFPCSDNARTRAEELQAEAQGHVDAHNELNRRAILINDLMNIQEQIRQLDIAIAALEIEIASTEAQIADLEDELADILPLITALQDSIDDAEDDIDDLQDEINAFIGGGGDPGDPYVTNRQTQIANLETQIAGWEDELDALTAENQAMIDELDRLETLLADQQAQLADLQAQRAVLQARFDALVASAGFAINFADMPGQRDSFLADAQVEFDEAERLQEQVRRELALGHCAG